VVDKPENILLVRCLPVSYLKFRFRMPVPSAVTAAHHPQEERTEMS